MKKLLIWKERWSGVWCVAETDSPDFVLFPTWNSAVNAARLYWMTGIL